MSYSKAKEIVSGQLPLEPISNRPNHSQLLYSQVTQQKSAPVKVNRPPPSTVQHRCLTCQNNKNLELQTTGIPPTGINVNLAGLVTFITDVIKSTLKVNNIEESDELLEIISTASSKYLGYEIDLKSLKDSSASLNSLQND